MRGTQSGSIAIKNVIVPWERALGFNDKKEFVGLGAFNTLLLPVCLHFRFLSPSVSLLNDGLHDRLYNFTLFRSISVSPKVLWRKLRNTLSQTLELGLTRAMSRLLDTKSSIYRCAKPFSNFSALIHILTHSFRLNLILGNLWNASSETVGRRSSSRCSRLSDQ